MVREPPDRERAVTPRTQSIAPDDEKLAPHGPAIKISTEARAYATTHGGTIYLRVRQVTAARVPLRISMFRRRRRAAAETTSRSTPNC
jgi:hypothetical protein